MMFELPASRQVLLARRNVPDKNLEESSPDHLGASLDMAEAASDAPASRNCSRNPRRRMAPSSQAAELQDNAGTCASRVPAQRRARTGLRTCHRLRIGCQSAVQMRCNPTNAARAAKPSAAARSCSTWKREGLRCRPFSARTFGARLKPPKMRDSKSTPSAAA